MRRALAVGFIVVVVDAGCGDGHRVRTDDAVRAALGAVVHAEDLPRGIAFPASGSKACRVRGARATCSTTTRRAQVGAVVVTFTAATSRWRHSWTYTVPPGDAGGPRGPAETGDPLPR